MTRYRTVVADPPWPYESEGLKANIVNRPNSWDRPLGSASARARYETMSMADLTALPVKALAEQDAHLYLWVTNAFMEEGHQLARAWGFQTKTIITWGKVHQEDHLRASMKTGYYFRGATEHVIFAVRGSLKTQGTWPTLFLWPRIGAHSQKPEAFIDMVEQASPGPYLELFSRRQRLGWDALGHGIDGRPIQDTMKELAA